jgi:glycosyltransferase involved in cell wall biosynthesis
MSGSKKIAIISAVYPPYRGGIGTVAFNRARLLANKGQDVTVFTPEYKSKQETVAQAGVNLVLLKPLLKYGNAAFVPQLSKILKNYDIVILEYPFFGAMRAVYSAKKKYGFKLILNYHMDTVASGFKGVVFEYVKKYFLPKIVNIADIVLASSADYAKHSALGKYWEDNNEKFKVLPNGIDMSKFKVSNPDEELRKNFNISPSEKIILFVGGLDKAHYFKGVEFLIRSVKHISSSRAFKVVIAGRGELQKQYRELSEQIGVKNRVMFTGGVSDDYLVKLYQMSYVTVLPSIDQSEAFGIVLVESMASGAPVIASNLPGVRSVFEDGISGLVSRVGDEKDLAEKISFLLNNSEKHKQMSDEGIKLVKEKYDWNKIGDKLVDIIL